MFDFYYTGQLQYVTVTDVTTAGDAESLAELVQKWDAEYDAEFFCSDVIPDFDVMAGSELFTTTTDVMDPDEDAADKATWTCRVDLSPLDWSHPWACRPILAAETVYHQRVTKEQLERNAALYVRSCAREYCVSTPLDADVAVGKFFDFLINEAEEVNPDPVAELLTEAMEDARPTSTGIPQLDSLLGGGLHRGLSILAGDPSAGKTALAVWFSLYTANQQGGRVVYDMADMGGKKSALLRMISTAAAVAGVGGCELGRAGEWSQREVYEGRQAFERVSKGRVQLCDTTEVTKLVSELDRLARENDVTFVALDFAQSMTYDERPLAFDAEAASLAVRTLRAWAHDHNAVVLLLSAYSKSAAEAHARGAAPQMSDVLGSAELAYSAEHVLALDNPHDGSGRVTVRDLKHRHGDGRPCALHLDSSHGLFS